MIKRSGIAVAMLTLLAACGSGGGSSTAGTNVQLSATPLAANSAPMAAMAKTFTTSVGHSVTLNKAYLVISSVTLQTSCDASFSAMLEGVLDSIIPSAHAHTTATPTSTGEPYVIDLLVADNTAVSIGEVQPPAADYCGATIDMLAADADASNLPVGAGVPNDMIGSSVYIEADYTLAGGGSGSFVINTSKALKPRDLKFSALMMLSASNLNDSTTLAINYDTWFNGVDLDILQAGSSNAGYSDQLDQVLMKITGSIHQL